ncbi:MAG: carboxypeptidase-like regulatory domain-containing protein, partial [Cyclobacteriaceae bacterium]
MRLPLFTLKRISIFLILYVLGSLAFSQELASNQRYLQFHQSNSNEHQSQKVALKDALEKLQNDLEIKFAYDEDLVEPHVVSSQIVKNADARKQDVPQLLEKLLSPLQLKARKVGDYYIIKKEDVSTKELPLEPIKPSLNQNEPALYYTQMSTALLDRQPEIVPGQKPTITVSGTVTDAANGSALPGVNVLVKGSAVGTVTDIEGKYNIEVPDNDGILIFSSIGYLTQEIPVNGRSVVDFAMSEDVQSLEEIVVVGYGSQLKKEVTGAVQSVDAAELRDLPVAQVTQKLQGRLAGVQINQTTGKPGQGMSVRIRGQLSVSGGSDPLFVVDGFPITGDINNINPDEIEDIT